MEMIVERILCTGGSGFIGTHLVDRLLSKGVELINLDIAAPKKPSHKAYWCECNILDLNHLTRVFSEFRPSHVIHLAARVSTDGKTLDDYQDNTTGTANLLKAIRLTPSVSRVVVASSQHVRKPGSGLPKHDEDYVPHGLYGESKVITEKLTRDADLTCTWTIIRPTTVWGPFHTHLAEGLWKLISKGWYVHPKNDPVIRSYGYVKNVAWGIDEMLNAPSKTVNRRVLYLGDDLIKQSEWIDSFSMALIGRKTTKIPKEWIHFLAIIGDAFGKIGVQFPMNSPRYFNLTTTNPVPVDIIIKQFGVPPYSLASGIAETVSWLKNKSRTHTEENIYQGRSSL
jgi:GlcNAc-P-P-Und epimerase